MMIRQAVTNDASQLIILLAQMGYEMTLMQMQERIHAFTENFHQLLVAEKDSIIKGLIAFACYEHFRISGKCCHIETLVVDHRCKGQGIGKQLVEQAEQYAQKHGAIIIELITKNSRRASGTHSFYEALNYQDHVALDYSYFAKECL